MTATEKFEFARVAFYGRDLDEYVSMFDLDVQALRGQKVLDCCAGPASFVKEAHERGINAVACDPMYKNEPEVLRRYVDEDAESVARKQIACRQFLHEELTPAAVRRQAMEAFLCDYERPDNRKRYFFAELPSLPFPDNHFDLVLCANFLFIYSDKDSGGMMDHNQFDYAFHKRALLDLLRVSRGEVRIYPLQGVGATSHKFLQPLMDELSQQGIVARTQQVTHRDIVGAEKMLRLSIHTPSR